MLEVEQVDVYYGNLNILKKLSFKAQSGEITAIVGSNGAGKSTILKAISGFVPVRLGKISFKGQLITAKQPYQIVDLGISLVDEGVKIFPYMTVMENLMLGAYKKSAWTNRANSMKKVFHLFPKLSERSNQQALTLSGGERRMLGIARGLMSQPDLLMFDEPSSGLAPIMVAAMFDAIKNINAEGNSILIVEQNVWESLSLAHAGYVIENGKNVIQGKGKDLLGNDEVKRAYLKV
jgi:branched-chain amino acid transport system ATP-binding protein